MFFITDLHPSNDPVNLDFCTNFRTLTTKDTYAILFWFSTSTGDSNPYRKWTFNSEAARDASYRDILDMVEEHRNSLICRPSCK